MQGRERVQAILHRKPADRVGFWLGNPADDTKFAYYKHLGIPCEAADTWVNTGNVYTTYSGVEDIEMGVLFNSDLMWIAPDQVAGTYKHPEGKPIFDVYGGYVMESLGMGGVCRDRGRGGGRAVCVAKSR